MTTTLASQANVDTAHAAVVIQQAYRQVFGNRHLMELDINNSIDTFKNGLRAPETAAADRRNFKVF